MAAHMHAEAMTAEKAPLSEKTKRRAACHSEIRTQREQANESMCECAMGEVRCANAVHMMLDQWTHIFLFRRKAPVKDMRDEAERMKRNERDGRGRLVR